MIILIVIPLFILLTVISLITIFIIMPEPEPELGMMSAEEFKAVIDKFANSYDLIQPHVNFVITTHEYYGVYGGLAGGDVEKAIRIFNHPDYPHNVYNYVFKAYGVLEREFKRNAEFRQLFDEEIVDFRIGTYGNGIVITVNPEYATQKNFDRYEKIFREHFTYEGLPITFEEYRMTDIDTSSVTGFISNPIITVFLFVFVSSGMVTYFVKNGKI